MTKAVLFKVNDGQWEYWKEWCTELSTSLRSEAMLTLEEEKLVQELTLSFNLGDSIYVIGYMDGDSLPVNMSRDINIKHKAMKDQCLQRVSEASVLYNLIISS